MNRQLLLAALVILGAISGFATKVCVSNAVPGSETGSTGEENATYYEVATYISNSTLRGAQLTDVEFEVGDPGKIQSLTFFLAQRLDKKQSFLFTQEVEIPADGKIALTLSSPYKMTGNTIYTGYKVTCAEDASPIGVATANGGMYAYCLRTSDSAGWQDKSNLHSLNMKVYFSGDYTENAVQITGTPAINVAAGEGVAYSLPIANFGAQAVESVTYAYEFGDWKGTATATLKTPLAAILGAEGSIDLEIPATGEVQESTGRVEVTAVNGVPFAATAEIPYNVVSYIPVNRPLMEEYTGTWCGNCTMPMASMKMMNDKYGKDFVVASIHYNDELSIMSSYPNDVNSAPQAWLNRVRNTHPSAGDNIQNAGKSHDIELVWLEMREEFTPASIHVDAAWADEAKSAVNAVATVEFVTTPPAGADYRVGYILTGNGITDESWHQSNYMSGYDGDDPYFLEYGQLADPILGPVYEDMAILYSDVKGVAGSLPEEMKRNEEYTHSYTLRLSDAKTLGGTSLVQDKDKMELIAYVIDSKSNRVLNAVRCEIPGSANVGELLGENAEAEAVSTEYYTIDGLKTDAPQPGTVTIRRTVFSDGTVRVSRQLKVKK